MNANRRILKAKRRGKNETQSTNTKNCPNASKQSRCEERDQHTSHYAGNKPGTSISPGTHKNIASARMKRLRESLANDLNNSNANRRGEVEQPPRKRFASGVNVQTQVSHSLALSSSTISSSSPIAAVPSPSMHNRLKAAASSTPNQRRSQPYPQIHCNTSNYNALDYSHPYESSNSYMKKSNSLLNASQSQNQSATVTSLSYEDVNFTDVSGNTSYSDLSMVCHANTSIRDELDDVQVSMDWSPVNEEMLLSDIRQARELLYEQSQHQQEQLNAFSSPLRRTTSNWGLNLANVYIVVDTNIFIDKLQTITNIMHIIYSDDSYPVIYVPWMVIQELDYFKDGYSLSDKHPISKIIQTRCRKAVKFINDCLIARKENFKGQPVQRAAETRIKSHTADDSILSCCVQLTNDSYEVILLSSDTNLRNKAIISDINAFSPNDIVKELTKRKATKKKRNFVEEISKKLSLICTFVLHFAIKSHYGDREYERKDFKQLPWAFKDCVKYFHEHYDPVFQPHVQKQCRKVIDDLHELFFINNEIVNEVKFMELCLSLLIYLQSGMPKYDSNIQNVIQEIKELEEEFLH